MSFGAGASFVLAAAVCSAVYFIVQGPLVARYGAPACTAYTLLSGALLLSPWLPEALRAFAAPAISTASVGAVVALGILPAALGYAARTYALGRFGAARAANFLYLVPPTGTALAFLLTGEAPSGPTLVGGAVAIGGVILVNLRGRA